jgi:predicted Zn-dependent protease
VFAAAAQEVLPRPEQPVGGKIGRTTAESVNDFGVRLSKDHPTEALDWSRRAAALGPEHPQYGYTYAFYLHQAGRLDQALRAIRSVRERHAAHEDSASFTQTLLRELSPAGKEPPSGN